MLKKWRPKRKSDENFRVPKTTPKCRKNTLLINGPIPQASGQLFAQKYDLFEQNQGHLRLSTFNFSLHVFNASSQSPKIPHDLSEGGERERKKERNAFANLSVCLSVCVSDSLCVRLFARNCERILFLLRIASPHSAKEPRWQRCTFWKYGFRCGALRHFDTRSKRLFVRCQLSPR